MQGAVPVPAVRLPAGIQRDQEMGQAGQGPGTSRGWGVSFRALLPSTDASTGRRRTASPFRPCHTPHHRRRLGSLGRRVRERDSHATPRQYDVPLRLRLERRARVSMAFSPMRRDLPPRASRRVFRCHPSHRAVAASGGAVGSADLPTQRLSRPRASVPGRDAARQYRLCPFPRTLA